MAVSFKHTFASGVADSGIVTNVRPSNWNAEHTVTAATFKLLGTAGTTTVGEVTYTAFSATLLDDATQAAARTTLGLVPGTDVQAQDAELAAIAGLTSVADRLPYFTGSGTAALATFTAFARTLLDDATAGAALGTLGAQASDAELTAIAGLTSAADQMPYFTGSGTAALTTVTSFMRTLLNDTTAAAARSTLGIPNHSDTFILAASDETTVITTGTAKVTMRAPWAMTATEVQASLTTSSSSGVPTFDINLNGTTMLSTKITIDVGEETSQTAAVAPVISDTSIAKGDEITVDFDVAGTGAKGVKIYIIGDR